MAITEQGVLAGLITLTVLGVLLIIIIATLDMALGLQTLAIFVALWSLFFGVVFAGLFAYDTVVASGSTDDDAAGNNTSATPAEKHISAQPLEPLPDDLMRAFDEQMLRARDADGLELPFTGDD